MIDLTPKRTKTGSPRPFHVLVDLDSLYSWYICPRSCKSDVGVFGLGVEKPPCVCCSYFFEAFRG